jgi:hypothetical protein
MFVPSFKANEERLFFKYLTLIGFLPGSSRQGKAYDTPVPVYSAVIETSRKKAVT